MENRSKELEALDRAIGLEMTFTARVKARELLRLVLKQAKEEGKKEGYEKAIDRIEKLLRESEYWKKSAKKAWEYAAKLLKKKLKDDKK